MVNSLIYAGFLLFTILVQPAYAQTEYEQQVLNALENIQNEDIDSSIRKLGNIISQYPNSKLGHLVLADLLAIRTGSSSLINQKDSDDKQLEGLRDEVRYRWDNNTGASPALSGLVPANLLQSPEQQYASHLLAFFQ